MSKIHNIPIRVEQVPTSDDVVIARSILAEIQAMVGKLLLEGEGDTIDLRSLPALNAASLALLEQWLPPGEIRAESVVAGVGRTEMRECAYPGIWWLVYRNQTDDIVTEQIQVALVPEILKSQEDDIVAGLKRLSGALSRETTGNLPVMEFQKGSVIEDQGFGGAGQPPRY